MTKKFFLAFIFFLLVAVIFTWPLLFELKSAYYGIAGENNSAVWWHWWLAKSSQQHQDWRFSPLIGAPQGVSFTFSPLPPLDLWYSRILAVHFDPLTAFNLKVLAGFVLSGFFMFLLMAEISGDFWPALLAGFYFTLLPVRTFHFYQSISLASTFWLVLAVFFMVKLLKKPGPVMMLGTAVSLALTTLHNYYYGFFTFIFCGFLFFSRWLIGLFKNIQPDLKINARRPGYLLLAFFLALALIYPFRPRLGTDHQSLGFAIPTQFRRDFADLYRYAAKPAEYLIPPVDQPLWGNISQKYFENRLHGSNLFEQTIFLGFFPVLLTLAGLGLFFRKESQSRAGGFFWIFFLAGFFSFYTSLSPSPHLPGLRLVTPSFFLYKFFPMFRVYSRLAVFVALSLAITAFLSLGKILEKIKNNPGRTILIAGSFLIIALEFINFPPPKITVFKPLASSLWLARQPGDFIVADYPLVNPDEALASVYFIEQTIHQKKMLNSPQSDSDADKLRAELFDLNQPAAAGLLAHLGVKYVVIHKNIFRNGRMPPAAQKYFEKSYLANLPAEWNQGRPFNLKENNNFRLAAAFQDEDIYQVVSRPAPHWLVWDKNFYPPERWADGFVWHWLSGEGTIEINQTESSPKKMEIHLLARSFQQTRRLTVYYGGQKIRELVLPGEKTVRLAPLVLKIKPGQQWLTFQSVPGPQNIDRAQGNGDGRDVSVALASIPRF